MGTLTTDPKATPPARMLVPIVINERIWIPSSVVDLQTFRDWALEEDFPHVGRVSWLDGQIWVDLEMGECRIHNQIRSAFLVAFECWLTIDPVGRYVGDSALYASAEAKLFTIPDGLFYRYDTVRCGRLLRRPRSRELLFFEGAADVVLEVVSESSGKKDCSRLRDSYAKAGVAEFWLIDARCESPTFDLLRLVGSEYESVFPEDGWLQSRVLSRSVRLVRRLDPLGDPRFVVEFRDVHAV